MFHTYAIESQRHSTYSLQYFKATIAIDINN